MSVSYWQQRPGQGQLIECEIAVVGAGLLGAYTADVLAAKGKKVALIESRFPAAGATGRNAGFCLIGAADNYASGVERWGRERTRDLWRLTLENQRKMRALVERFEVPFEPCGGWILAMSEDEGALLTRSCEWMQEDGIPVEFSKKDPLGRGFGVGLLQPGDFGLDPVALARAMLQDAIARGAQVVMPAEVFAIQPSGGKLRIEARGATVECEKVAICANAYAPLLSSFFADKVSPVRGQLLATAPLPARILDRLAYADRGYYYFRQLPDLSFLMGGARHLHRDAEVGYDDSPTGPLQDSLEDFLRRYFPEAAAAPVARRWAGTMGFSVDGLPLVGQLPDLPGVFYAVGMTGHGYGWGVSAADLMMAQMLGDRPDAGLFDAARLQK